MTGVPCPCEMTGLTAEIAGSRCMPPLRMFDRDRAAGCAVGLSRVAIASNSAGGTGGYAELACPVGYRRLEPAGRLTQRCNLLLRPCMGGRRARRTAMGAGCASQCRTPSPCDGYGFPNETGGNDGANSGPFAEAFRASIPVEDGARGDIAIRKPRVIAHGEPATSYPHRNCFLRSTPRSTPSALSGPQGAWQE